MHNDHLHESIMRHLFLSMFRICTPDLFTGYTPCVSFIKSFINICIIMISNLSSQISLYTLYIPYKTDFCHFLNSHNTSLLLLYRLKLKTCLRKYPESIITLYLKLLLQTQAAMPSFVYSTKKVTVLLLLYYTKNS